MFIARRRVETLEARVEEMGDGEVMGVQSGAFEQLLQLSLGVDSDDETENWG